MGRHAGLSLLVGILPARAEDVAQDGREDRQQCLHDHQVEQLRRAIQRQLIERLVVRDHRRCGRTVGRGIGGQDWRARRAEPPVYAHQDDHQGHDHPHADSHP